MNKTQKDFSLKYAEKKKNGLVDINFFTGDLSGATVDSFIAEDNAIDEAIANGKYTPFPEKF